MDNGQVDILLVEDNPQDAELILRTLQKQNITGHVQLAQDGAEALEFLFAPPPPGVSLQRTPKVILLDLKLPKVSGLEVLQRIKADARTKAIPVVILTSSHEDRDIADCYQLGANSYVVKPVAFDAFTNAMAQLGSYWLQLNQTRHG